MGPLLLVGLVDVADHLEGLLLVLRHPGDQILHRVLRILLRLRPHLFQTHYQTVHFGAADDARVLVRVDSLLVVLQIFAELNFILRIIILKSLLALLSKEARRCVANIGAFLQNAVDQALFVPLFLRLSLQLFVHDLPQGLPSLAEGGHDVTRVGTLRLLRDLFARLLTRKVGGCLGEHGIREHLRHLQISSHTVRRPLFCQLLDGSCGHTEHLGLLVGRLLDIVAQSALEVLDFALSPLLLHNRAVGLLVVELPLYVRFQRRFARQRLQTLHVVETGSLGVSGAVHGKVDLRAGSLVLL